MDLSDKFDRLSIAIDVYRFLFFAFSGTQVANIPSGDSASNSTSGAATGFNVTILLYISLVFGFSFMVNVWVFFRIPGSLSILL